MKLEIEINLQFLKLLDHYLILLTLYNLWEKSKTDEEVKKNERR